MPNPGLWLRWSWRDLRERWFQVGVVALIIALGSGVYAGLGSTTPWRLKAADDSYALLHMYDLRVRFVEGSYVDRDELLRAVQGIEHARWITALEPRLIATTLVSVPATSETIVVRGQMIGVDVTDGGPRVNGVYIQDGRALSESDAGQNTAILEYHFARHYHLPAQGTLTLSGGVAFDYVGVGTFPEHLVVATEEGGFMAEAIYAVIVTPLATAQAFTEHSGMVNDLVLTLAGTADQTIIQDEIEAALAGAFPRTSISFIPRADEQVHKLLYETIRLNQEIYDLMAYLFLAGAALGAFNLASRIAESQRRQIGIGMALGTPPRLLMIRPLLIGLQIATLGAICGVFMGVLVSKLAAWWVFNALPMPVMHTPFQTGIFLRGAILGFVLPFAATLYPVWRAVRVLPVDAIRTGHLASKGGGLAPLLARLPVPGKSFVQMPIRNLLRAPRRTMFTLTGIASAITILVGMFGVLDSTLLTIDRIAGEALQDHPDRLTVYLNSVYPLDAPQMTEITGSPVLSAAEPLLFFPANAMHGGTDLKVFVELLDLDSALWSPTLIAGRRPANGPGLLLAEKAAHDLGVKPGDTVILELPRREGLFAYRMVRTEIPVSGIHADPWRMVVYMDLDQAELMGLEGMVNAFQVNPAAGVSRAEVKATLFQQPTVASVIAAHDHVDFFDTAFNEIVKFMSGVVTGVLVLAFLIALNSTNINLSERAREIATLFAFGLPPRTVTRMAMLENLLTGLLGTLLGVGAGALLMFWLIRVRMAAIMVHIQYSFTLSTTTLMMTVGIGVVVVALAPLFTIRRMARMDIPSTLRVME